MSTNLVVVDKAHELVLKVYRLTKGFAHDELFGLTGQMRRAAISIPSNIIEGRAKQTTKDFNRFLWIARGSLEELKYQLLLSKDLEYITKEQHSELKLLSEEVGKLLHGLINRLNHER